MLPYQERMQEELNQLRERRAKLNSFCSTVSFSLLNKEDQELLVNQEGYMHSYEYVLSERLQKSLSAPNL